jgi:hypothetical protein
MLLVHMALEHGDLEARISAIPPSSKIKKVDTVKVYKLCGLHGVWTTTYLFI